jgi:hypothetical protein
MIERASGRRSRVASAAVALGLAATVPWVAGCRAPGRSSDADALLEGATPPGFRLDLITSVPPPGLAPIMTDRTLPLTTTVGVYRAEDDPPRAITTTIATLADPVGARALYNNYFATNAFMASIDRHALDIGDQAECFDGQWPAFHAVIARKGRLFVLVEADIAVPREQCRDLVAALVDGWPDG